MTQNQVTREQALAIVELIKEQMEAAYARLIAMPVPDLRLQAYAGPAALRRSAARLRAGTFRPSWMTGTPEETAREYEAAAEFCETLTDVRRLAKTHEIVKEGLRQELFNQVKENFLGLKKFGHAEWLDPVTAENILTLRRDVRRDLGRK